MSYMAKENRRRRQGLTCGRVADGEMLLLHVDMPKAKEHSPPCAKYGRRSLEEIEHEDWKKNKKCGRNDFLNCSNHGRLLPLFKIVDSLFRDEEKSL